MNDLIKLKPEDRDRLKVLVAEYVDVLAVEWKARQDKDRLNRLLSDSVKRLSLDYEVSLDYDFQKSVSSDCEFLIGTKCVRPL